MAETAHKPTSAKNTVARPYARAGAELADLSPDSVILFDLGGAIQYWNRASEKLYGLTAIGATGRNIQDMSATAASDVEHWYTLLQQGDWEGEIQRRTPWGDHVAVKVKQTVRYGEDGRPRDIVEYGRVAGQPADLLPKPEPRLPHLAAAGWELDISAVRPLLDLLGRSEPFPDQLLSVDQAKALLSGIRIVDVNDRTVELVGAFAGREGMIGQPLDAFWPIVTRDVLAEMIVTIAAKAAGGPAQIRRPVRDGILRNPVLTLWRSETPERRDTLYIAINGAADDNRSFWHVRASEERYRKLIHYLPSALLQVDAQTIGTMLAELKAGGLRDLDAYLNDHQELTEIANSSMRVIEANREAVTLFGANAPADFIQPVSYVFAASPSTMRRVMIAQFEERRSYSEVMKLQTFDRRTLDVRLTVIFPISRERLDITLLYIEDITERLRTERQLRQLEADFTHSARISMIGELAASIAHEVNQPLSAIVTNGETSLRWLSRTDPNIAKVTDLTTRIVSNARRASEVVQRIRGMAANREPARVAINLNGVVEEALLFLRHDLESKAIALSASLAWDLPNVTGDRVQLQQVIVNLLVNSIQAIAQAQPATRRIELETESDEGTVTFSIRDTGPGIETENIDRIFESFFTTKEQGVGIGLAICQSIVMAHGGSLSVANHPDGGALFSVSLPRQRS